MIREIINFTKALIEDMPEILQMNNEPDNGLHVFIDINQEGVWTNCDLIKGVDYDFFDGKNRNMELWNDCVKYQEATDYITMNKVKRFDKEQKIHSCSPFAIAYNFNFNDKDKKALGIKVFKKTDKPTQEEKDSNDELMREKRLNVIRKRLDDYKNNAVSIYHIDNMNGGQLDLFNQNAQFDMSQIDSFYSQFDACMDSIKLLPEYKKLSNKDYIHIYLRSIPFDIQKQLHDQYIQENLFNDEFEGNGVVGFLTSYSAKKPYLYHKTNVSRNGVSQWFTKEDAMQLFCFEKLWKRKCFPRPLPIVVDQKEINKEIVKLYNENSESLTYRDLLVKLFDKINLKYLSNYYLINYVNTKDGIVINDFDFVPMFRYEMSINIKNVCCSGIVQDKVFKEDSNIQVDTIFDFERIIVREIFNNSLVKIKDNKYTTNYFGEIKPEYVSGGDICYQMILKYRRAFYDFIYKSRINAIEGNMFNDMMYNSVLSNIRNDKITTRCEWNNNIKKKLNIWFSLYNLFNNNSKEIDMVSKVKELQSKMTLIAKQEADIETPEEFAFGAGQLVSYLIDRSAASDKTYAMLEPYLQKGKSNQLQDAIAHTITIYKHDIKFSKDYFEALASQVLTNDCNAEMKPLLKFFLAGCFSPCVIYEKRNNN